jgi:hypothetical protein
MKKISFFTFIGILMAVIIFTSPLFAETMRGIRVVSKKGDSIYLYESYHAMVIGITDYEYWPKLPHAIKDAKEVAQKLQKFGFETKLVFDPTYREMKTAINEMIYKMGNEENRAIVFYYAGHGETETLADKTKMGYIIPKDCPLLRNDPMGFAAHAVSMRDIESASLRIQSKHVLMLFDSCFSGSLFALTRAVPDDITEKSNLPVRQYITAGREDEQVPDKSMFKRSLLIGIDGDADRTGDGYVTGTELGMYLADKVVNYTHRRQHPQYGKINNPDLDRGDFIFVPPSLEQELKAKKPTGQPVKQEQTAVPVAPSGQKTKDPSLELAFWGAISNSNDVDMLNAYVNQFPNGTFVGLAKIKIQKLSDAELAKIKIQKLSEDASKKKVEPKSKVQAALKVPEKEETKVEPKSKVLAALKVPEKKITREELRRDTATLIMTSNIKGAAVVLKNKQGIIIDNGKTPYTKKGLKPGLYKIQIFKDRFNYYTRRKIGPGRITKLHVKLKGRSTSHLEISDRSGNFTNPAAIVVRSNIEGAYVTLKQIGKSVFLKGNTPYKKTGLAPGMYRLTVSYGSNNLVKWFYLIPSSTAIVKVRLRSGTSQAKIEFRE